MSDTTQTSRSSGSSRRRRSRGGKNRSRSHGGSPNQPQSQTRGGGHPSKSARAEEFRPQGPRPPRNAPPAPQLSWWQKLLKAIGLYKEPVRPARVAKPQAPAKTAPSEPRAAKTNTRNARTDAKSEKPAGDSAPKRNRSESPKRRGGDGSSVESSRVYVGNLSYDVTEQDLQELFKGVGPVRNVEIVYNRSTHRSKGYGFVEMLHKDEAVRAVEVLHDQPFMGRKMIVSGAKSKGQDEREERDEREDRPQQRVTLAPLPEKKAEPAVPAETAPASETTAAPAVEPQIQTVVESVVESAAVTPADDEPAAAKTPADTADDLVAKYGFDESKEKSDA